MSNLVFTSQYKEHKGLKVVIEMYKGRWVWTVDPDGEKAEISDQSFETPELAFDDAKEFIDTVTP